MIVEQAVFASANTRTISGYHLVAQSPGVSDAVASELLRWAPTKSAMASDDENFESLNSFVVIGDRLAVSRTLYGRPEYSKRGDLETSTRFLIVPLQELSGYNFDPLWFARTALTLGYLRLSTESSSDLPSLELPNQALLGATTPPPPSAHEELLNQAVHQLVQGRRVALVGLEDELAALAVILASFDAETRQRMSFSTGLLPSGVRPFHLHFLSYEAHQANSRLSTHELDFLFVQEEGEAAEATAPLRLS